LRIFVLFTVKPLHTTAHLEFRFDHRCTGTRFARISQCQR
jgi:hypothetical protein